MDITGLSIPRNKDAEEKQAENQILVVCPECHGYGSRGHGRYPARIIKCWQCRGTGYKIKKLT